MNVQLFARTSGFAEELNLVWEYQLRAAVSCDMLEETAMTGPGSYLACCARSFRVPAPAFCEL